MENAAARIRPNSGDLWAAAVASLDDEIKFQLDDDQLPKQDALDKLLSQVEISRKGLLEKSWSFRRKNGEKVIVRDVLAKLVKWVDHFKAVGDTIVQYDPVHAALPWAGVRFVLTVAMGDISTYGILLEKTATIAEIICRNSIVEELLRKCPESPAASELDHALVKLYANILTYLGKTRFYYRQNTPKRMLKGGLFALDELELYFTAIDEAQKDVAHCSAIFGLEGQLERHNELKRIFATLDTPIARWSSSLESITDQLKTARRLQILQWISSEPYEQHHNQTREGVLPGTGTWLLQDPVYLQWKNESASSILWLRGIPGSGKSKLTSIVVKDAKDSFENGQAPAPVFFYCSRNPAEPGRSDPSCILASISRQLSTPQGGGSILEESVKTYEAREAGGFASGPLQLDETKKLILKLLTRYEDATMTIVIDALDECNKETRWSLIEILGELLKDSRCLLKIFISSRNDQDIVYKLSYYPNLYLSSDRNSEDINLFVRSETQRLIEKESFLRESQRKNEIQSEIIRVVSSKADGMFRWASLQLQALKKLTSDDAIMERLGRLPESLDKLYQEILSEIESSQSSTERALVKGALSWLLTSQRQLKSDMFLIAVSVTKKESSGKISQSQLLALCRNLLIFDSSLDAFRFSHLSVREFLESHNEYTSELTNACVAERCIWYLTMALPGDFESHGPDLAGYSDDSDSDGSSSYDSDSDDGYYGPPARRRRYHDIYFSDSRLMSILKYSARCWASHTHPVGDSRLMSILKYSACCWVSHALAVGDSRRIYYERFSASHAHQVGDSRRMSILKYSARFWASHAQAVGVGRGLHLRTTLLEFLFENGNVSTRFSRWYDRFGARLVKKPQTQHVQVLWRKCPGTEKLSLLRTVCSFDLCGVLSQREWIGLCFEAERSELSVEKFIVAHGCVEIIEWHLREQLRFEVSMSILRFIVLNCAMDHGKEMIDILLEKRGSEIQITEQFVKTIASVERGEEILALLLEKRGAEIRVTKDLIKAAADNFNGKPILALLLRQRGAGIHITEDFLKSVVGTYRGKWILPLLFDEPLVEIQITQEVFKAAVKGYAEGAMVRLLLDKRGADIQVTEDIVIAAAANSDESSRDIMAALLEKRGDEIQITEEVVKAATSVVDNGVLSLLLEKRGADIPITEEVIEAAATDYKAMTILLDNCGDEIQVTEKVVEAAILSKSTKVLSWLLEKRGAEIQITEELIKAAARDKDAMTTLLDDFESEIQMTDEIIKAAATNKKAMALLLDRFGDEIQMTEEIVKAAASCEGSTWVMSLLLERCGAEIQITEGVLKAVMESLHSKNTLALLLEKSGSEIHLTEAVLKEAMYSMDSVKVLDLLLKKLGDKMHITEDILKAAVKAFHATDTLAWLLENRWSEVHVTEGVLKAAIQSYRNEKVLPLLFEERESEIQITEEVVKAAAGDKNFEGIWELLRAKWEKEAVACITSDVCLAAATSGHLSNLRLLREYIPPQDVNPEWEPVAQLFRAAEDGDSIRVGQLLSKQIPIDIRNIDGNTPLSIATWNNSTAVVEILAVQRNVDVNSLNRFGQSPLLLASNNGNDEIVKTLLSAGAQTHLADIDGRTALSVAKESGYRRVVKMLMDAETASNTGRKSRKNHSLGQLVNPNTVLLPGFMLGLAAGYLLNWRRQVS